MTPVRTRLVGIDIASNYPRFLAIFSFARVVPYSFFVAGRLQSLDGCV